MDSARFIQVYIVQVFIIFFYLWIANRILKRNKNRLNLFLSLFYIINAVAFIINVIYANIFNEEVVTFLHFIVYYLVCLSLVFPLLFLLILQKGEELFSTNKQVFLLMIYAILLLGLWGIPNGITINESTDWKPAWNWEFLLYAYIVVTIVATTPTLYYTLKIKKTLESPTLNKRWSFFLLGIIFHFIYHYGTSFSNTLNNPTFRLVWAIICIPILSGAWLIYYGVGQQFKDSIKH